MSRRHDPAPLSLVCLPHAGGSAHSFRRWRGLLPPTLRLVPLDMPGRGRSSGTAPATALEEAAERLLPCLSSLGRFAILGHSLGGLLAYELAKLMLASGSALPDFLVLAATRPPHEVSASRHAEVCALPDEEMLDELALTGHVPAHLRHSPMRSVFVPGLRADLALLSRYRPTSPIRSLPVTFLSWSGSSDAIAPNDAMAAWRPYTTRDFLGTEFSGGHFFLHEQPSAIATVLAEYLATLLLQGGAMHKDVFSGRDTARFEEWSPPTFLPFHWHVYDIGSALPAGWDTALLDLARRQAVQRRFRPTMSTAREAANVEIPIESVDGEQLYAGARWIHELYEGWFRGLAERLSSEVLQTTSTLNRALSLNIQRANGERYPCHVDSNPMQGLLYLTDCDEETGGGLVIARGRDARDIEEVVADCGVIYPRRGQLYFFDAREHAHYVAPIKKPDVLRAVVTMNYYSPSCPESIRPSGLDEQLFGK